MTTRIAARLLTALCVATAGSNIRADAVALSQPTATYSQLLSGSWTVGKTIDANTVSSGWAIQRSNTNGVSETAVYETTDDIGFAGGTELVFRIKTRYVNSDGAQNIGRFRLSVTSDNRSEFADGLANNGDVTATWEPLDPFQSTAVAGAILTKLPDLSLLASGTNALEETYTVVAYTSNSRITGIRLETLADASLPGSGPGRGPGGNFVLVDFQVSVNPSMKASIQVASVDVCWPGTPEVRYQVQYSSTLTTNEWMNLGEPVVGTGTNCITDSAKASELRFYRIIEAP